MIQTKGRREKKRKTEGNEEEESGRVEAKADKPPSKKRVNAMVRIVKNDDKKKDQKPSQQSQRN